MLSNIPPEKKIALKLYSLSWWQRLRLIKSLPVEYRSKVKNELTFLKKFEPNHLTQLIATKEHEKLISKNSDIRALCFEQGLSESFARSLAKILENKDQMPTSFVCAIESLLVCNKDE